MRISTLLAAAAMVMPSSLLAATITYEASLIDGLTSESGVRSFTTTGANMTGLAVTAEFAGGATETVTFAPTGASSGAGVGSLFSVTQANTTYSNPFRITNLSAQRLQRLRFDGAPGSTLFDRNLSGAEGTPGSSAGTDLTEFGTVLTGSVVVTYSGIVSLGAAAAAGDLFAYLSLDLTGLTGGGLATNGKWAFVQDTDTLAVADDLTPISAVPVPAAGGLLAAGLLALGVLRRRSRAA